MPKKYLVTPALPYANGAIHIGHLVEHVQVNIFVRALRMAGEDVLCVCGADSHGTAIELSAEKAGVRPEDFVKACRAEHSSSFEKFGIEFDGGYGMTHTSENEFHAQKIYEALEKAEHISTRNVEQLFDPEANRFLSDRMVKGMCPKCKAEDQYGDSCEICSATYAPNELVDPRSAISGARPVLKSSLHYFFQLGHYSEALQEWTGRDGVLSSDVRHYLDKWFEGGLQDWDISRDGPYFGFKIPGTDDKYFYVWLDAPVGYIALAERAAKERGLSWEDYWKSDDVEIIHFIGKDIIYFHTLFWPAMLMGAGYTLPHTVAVHGMLTVDGQKMSKSRGTFILADTFSEFLEPESLRYYLACKLNQKVEDIDLNLEDFTTRVNADLVNKIVNLLSRSVPMLHRHFDGKLGLMDDTAKEMLEQVATLAGGIEGKYRARLYSHVVRDVVEIADLANRYFQDAAPWVGVKTHPLLAHKQLTTALWVGKVCVALLKPVIPTVATRTEEMFGLKDAFTFANLLAPFETGDSVGEYPRLFERLDPKKIKAMVEKSKRDQAHKTPEKKKSLQPKEENATTISYDDFMSVELRVARVEEANHVEGADKLISVQLDVGNLGKRHVFAGLKPHVQPEEMLGHNVVLVANLKPRQMRFGLSEGMILAGGDAIPKPVYVPEGIPGDRVR